MLRFDFTASITTKSEIADEALSTFFTNCFKVIFYAVECSSANLSCSAKVEYQEDVGIYLSLLCCSCNGPQTGMEPRTCKQVGLPPLPSPLPLLQI
jgi:hypothetical protein